jgi:hypothetical protein
MSQMVSLGFEAFHANAAIGKRLIAEWYFQTNKTPIVAESIKRSVQRI